MMNQKLMTMAVATVLALPLAMPGTSGADGGRRRSGTSLSGSSGGTSTSMEFEYERHFVVADPVTAAATGRGEVEVELEKKTKTSSTGVITNTTKLETEIEALLPGTALIDPATLNANILVGTVPCTFSPLARTAVVPVVKNGLPYTKVVIEGSSVVVSPATTATDKGLACVGDITLLLGNELVAVTGISGFGGTVADPTPGPLVLDD